MGRTIPFRLPRTDYVEIKRIAADLDINLQSAYKIWKKKIFNDDSFWRSR